MNIAAMAWRIGDILDIDAQIEWIADAGFDGLAFHASAGAPGQWQGVDPASAHAARRRQLHHAVERFAMCEIHAPFHATLQRGAVRAAADELLPVFDFAGDVGASVVTVHANPPTSEDGEPWTQAMAELDDRAAARGLVIGLEVTDGFDWVEALGLPRIGVTLDVGHMHVNNAKPLAPFGTIGAVVEHVAERLVHLHIHDYDGEHDHIELGAGHIDLEGVLRALKQIRYDSALCLELNPDRVSPDGIVRSMEWLRARLD